MATIERNEDTARRWFEEFWNQDDPSVLEELASPEYVVHVVPPGVQPNFEGMKEAHEMHRSGFPDMQFTIDEMVAEDDRVATHVTFTGTHEGEWAGIPPTGREVTYSGIDVSRLAEGKFRETWLALDLFGCLQQLGVIPD